MRTVLLTCCLGMWAMPALLAQAPAAPTPEAQAPAVPPGDTPPSVPPVPAALPMAGPAGMIFHAVKADRAADFEAVMTRLRDLLALSTNEVRRAQAAGWRVYRQAAPLADGNVLFVSVLDPVVANAEYDVPRLIAEAAPTEAAQLYEQFRDAHVQPTVQASNLSLVLSLGPVDAPAQPQAPPQPPVPPAPADKP